ncbi:C2H2-type domain-containing protein [Meloidogyne graminicola]|uniref:C2H2-type domain-containing protein n=1 Tax=Meloidogyne graminicola TaxID=189291 RepID=A0A8S9ZH20_9BILA|nr:C2H2-type domain-containing protein [Meloidogyne graminicola]
MFPDEDGIFERLTAERTKIEAKENTKINRKSPTTSLDTLPSSFIPSSPASCSQDEEIIIIETNNINESDNEINIEDCTTKNEKNLTIQKDETILCEKVVTKRENLKIENTTNELDENTKISPSVSSFDCISSSSTKDDSLSLEEHKIELDDQNESNKEETQSNNEDQKSPQKLKNGKIPCRWANCKEVFYDEDGLYDHLTLAHIDVLTKWVIAEQGEIEKQQKNNGIKRRRSSTNLSIENVKERFRCQWRKCEQYPRRGDAQKKIDWLLNHLVFRHAPKSRPHKCLFEGCTLRFSKVGTLRDHIRCTHNEIKNKQNGKKSTEENHTKITCFEFRPCVVHFPFVNDCIDSRTIEWTRNEMTKTKKEQRMIFSNPEREFRRGRKRIKVEIEENTKIKKEIITNEKVRGELNNKKYRKNTF